jgi:hypothetical protein
MIFDDIRYYIDILYIVPVIFIVLARKYVANPRMGVVKLARRRVRKSRLIAVAYFQNFDRMYTVAFPVFQL